MNEPLEFKTVEELYNRVLPALYSKVKELKNFGYKYVTEKDIWNYLVNTSWKKKIDLQLNELICDILYADNYTLNEYVMQKIGSNRSNDIKDDEIL